MSTTQQVAKQDSSSAVANTASSAVRKTTESVYSVGANVGGAFSFAGGAHAGASSYKRTTTTSSGDQSEQQLSKAQADQLYEERMEDEYAKREGGA
jgi:hypothetical protein